MSTRSLPVAELPLSLERDVFLRSMLRELAGSLQDIVGLDEASGFISAVGQSIGDDLNAQYRSAADVAAFDRPQVSAVLIDLKRRIQGGFELVDSTDARIEMTNTACPFGDKVLGRPALCMMTSNVFGTIAAENLGYARVVLHETIANGDGRCRVTVHLHPDDGSAVDHGREYFAR
ncbi:methanogen output domain 1-containing protein [Gemmatimonas sp.]